MGTILIFIALLILTALLSSSAFFFFPIAKEANAEPALAIAFASSITQLLALFYFLSSLRIIKRSLRTAYYLFSFGILLFSLLQLIPASTIIPKFASLYSNLTVANILFLTPFGLGALLMFLGMQRFYSLLTQTKFFRGYILIVLAIAAAVAGIFIALPHAPESIDATARGVISLCAVFGIAAMLVGIRVRNKIGKLYQASISATVVALGAIAFTSLHELIVKSYFINTQYAISSLAIWPYLVTGVLLLWAGLNFRKTERNVLSLPANPTYVDIVVTASQMVSNPAAIDNKLDDLRIVTSHQTGTELSETDKNTLARLYLEIEKYLTTKEPLYAYTSEGLRANLPAEFLQRVPK